MTTTFKIICKKCNSEDIEIFTSMRSHFIVNIFIKCNKCKNIEDIKTSLENELA